MSAPGCADEVLARTVRPREWTSVIEKASEAAVASLMGPLEGAPVTGLERPVDSLESSTHSTHSRFSEEAACETGDESSFSRHTVHGACNFAELFAREPQDAKIRADGAQWRMPIGLLHEAAHEAARSLATHSAFEQGCANGKEPCADSVLDMVSAYSNDAFGSGAGLKRSGPFPARSQPRSMQASPPPTPGHLATRGGRASRKTFSDANLASHFHVSSHFNAVGVHSGLAATRRSFSAAAQLSDPHNHSWHGATHFKHLYGGQQTDRPPSVAEPPTLGEMMERKRALSGPTAEQARREHAQPSTPFLDLATAVTAHLLFRTGGLAVAVNEEPITAPRHTSRPQSACTRCCSAYAILSSFSSHAIQNSIYAFHPSCRPAPPP